MRRKATSSKGSGWGRGSHRRLAILLATVAAFMLVPAAQAFAGTFTLNIAGTGTGYLGSVGGLSKGGEFEGTPPIECVGPPVSGSCVSEMEVLEGEGIEGIALTEAIAAPGSELAAFIVEEGIDLFGTCEALVFSSESSTCAIFQETGAGNAAATAIFECETEGGCEGPALTVAKEGTGSGTVVSNPVGIDCGKFCRSTILEENTKVTLTASPSAGSTFVSWKGCDKGGVNGRQCTVTMDKAKTVNAKFLTAYDVTVNRVGSGLGKVSSSPGGVLCLSNCSSTTAAFKEGSSVTLTATPSKNYAFTEWTGDCSGSSPTCSLGTLAANKSVGAKFSPVPQFDLALTKSGGGNGTVKATQAGINCGATCSAMAAAYYQGTEVELTVTPGKGSSFGGWSGSAGPGTCTGTTNPCKVTMSEVKELTAEFK